MFLIRSNGTDLPKHPILNFLGGTVSEDLDNNQILVQLGGGGAGFPNLTSNFTQPAVGSAVVVPVTLSSAFQPGATVFLFGGGFYTISAVPTSTSLTLINTGAVGNAAPAATVTSGVLVIPSGPAPLLLEANGTPVTMRGVLNLIGLTYADVGGAMQFTASGGFMAGPWVPVAPGATVSVAVNTWYKVTDTTSTLVTFNFPSAPVAGSIAVIKLKGATVLNPVRLNAGAGDRIEDPQNAGVYSGVAGQVAISTAGAVSAFKYDAGDSAWTEWT